MSDIPWKLYEEENEATRAAASIPTVPDEYDRLRRLITTYGALRYQAGYRLGIGHPDAEETGNQGNSILDELIILLTQLQRQAGGGL